jgi:FkbM family methyltransferase
MLKYRGSQLHPDLDMVISQYRVTHPQISFLQVGAFDGISADPIYPLLEKHRLHGILVEPQRDAFERLKMNYAHFEPEAFLLVNAAIGAHDGTAVLYRIKPDAPGPSWLPGIASFDRAVVMKHSAVVPNLESFIRSEEVRCMTFATLFKETGIQRIDLLMIDAEGYDVEILRLFDIPSHKPAIIHFEHKHLSVADHQQSLGTLVDLGYKFVISGENTLAYLG